LDVAVAVAVAVQLCLVGIQMFENGRQVILKTKDLNSISVRFIYLFR